MVPGIHRPAVVKVNLGAIKRNLENEMEHLEPGQKMLAVVKANGYGHGAVEVARDPHHKGVKTCRYYKTNFSFRRCFS